VCVIEREIDRESVNAYVYESVYAYVFTNFLFQESNLNRINDLWRSQLRKMIVKLLIYLSKYPSTETPSFQSIFGDDDPTQIAVDRGHASDENVKLVATNDVIFYTMLSILKLQPYANPVSSVRINSAFAIALLNIHASWCQFEAFLRHCVKIQHMQSQVMPLQHFCF